MARERVRALGGHRPGDRMLDRENRPRRARDLAGSRPDRGGFELLQAWWGRGLATEGALAALRFGFDEHGLERIISVTAVSHASARRVMEKAGLTYQGTRYWMSREVPVVWYAIDRTHERQRREPHASRS